jgi:regulatory protein
MTEKRRPAPLDAAGLLAYAVRSLAVRACTSGEMREKLRRRAERASDVDDVISRLKDLRYLDDRRFAESFANARVANDKLGSRRVLLDLRRRRVAPALAESATRQAYRGVDELSLIEDWIRRTYRNTPREALFAEEKDLASAYRRLLRAGFKTGEILRALKRFAKDPELLDNFEPPQEELSDE